MKLHHVRALTGWVLLAGIAGAAAGCSGEAPPSTGSSEQALDRDVRLLLSDAVLKRLKARAAAGDAAWKRLKDRCDSLTTGKFNLPNQTAYPSFPNVGQGYYGDGYLPEIMNLGLCYRVVEGSDSKAAAEYAKAGERLLSVMATPPGSGGQAPSGNSGYGIRNYGVGMAFGFDWLYPGLSSTAKTRVITALNSWIDWYDKSGFLRNDPIGNYFMGYYLAKVATAIATEGDNSKASTYWNDVETRLWGKLVKPKFEDWMVGGGWPEGWGYGPRATQAVLQAAWAAKTGKGLNWWSLMDWADDQAKYIQYFTWPSLQHIDDQGTVHATKALRPSTVTMMALTMMMEYNGDPYASTARSFTQDLIDTLGEGGDAWQRFLFWDPTLASTDYKKLPLSYHARGPNHVAVRSSWEKDAVWGTFVSGQYINARDSGEQYFNQGSVALVQGDQPILVNPTGWLPQVAGDQGEAYVYKDTWGDRTRLLNNTFFVAGATQYAPLPSKSSTRIERFEDGIFYVRARGLEIEDMYRPSGVLTQFIRDYVFVRPNAIVVFDRTTTGSSSTDQWLSWHTPTDPVSASTSDKTQRRYDVRVGSNTVGSIRTLLPKNASLKKVSILSGKTYRLEERAPSKSTTNDWLTVVTAGSSVPEQTRLSADDGNVTAGNLVGVHLAGARNAVVLFGADHAGTGTNSSATYEIAQTADADHVLFDMAPSSTGYSVTASTAGGVITVKVQQGGPFKLTSKGTLAFVVTTSGKVMEAPKPVPEERVPIRAFAPGVLKGYYKRM